MFLMHNHFKIAKKRAISVIVGALLMVLIAVGMGTVIFAYSSNVGGSIGDDFSTLLGNSAAETDEQLTVEQSYFNYSSASTSGQSYVPITFTNSQTSATASPFQQMLTIEPTLYTQYEASDLGNIRFYTTLSNNVFSGAVDSWLEYVSSTPANQATSATFWLSLPNGIPASSSTNVYMVFEPTSTEFDGVVAGEAPQLSATFGEYDNGANVFLYYDNGATTSNLNVVNGGSLTVTSETNPYGASSSVLTLAGSGSTSTSQETVAWYTSALIGDNFIAEGWIDISSNLNGLFAIRGSSSSTDTNYLMGDGWSNNEASVVYESGTTNTVLSGAGSRSAGWFWDMATISGSSLTTTVYTSPPYLGGTVSSTTTVTDTTLGASNQYVGIGTWSGSTSSAYFFGIRIRADPPNGVMPSSTPGSVSATTTSSNGADLFVTNVGPSASVISAVYVVNAQSDSLVASDQFSTAITIQPGSTQEIGVDFAPTYGLTYEFFIATQAGNTFTYNVAT